jgi:hypothetical protein
MVIGKNDRLYPPIQNSPEATTTNNPLASGGTTIGVDACQYFIPSGWAYTDVSDINPVLAVLGPDNADYTYPETVRITGISKATGAGNLTVSRGVGATATIGAPREWPLGTKIAAVNTAQQLQQVQDNLSLLSGLGQYQPLWDASDNASITGLTGTAKWYGACLAPNGKIYCVPCNSTEVLIIDPATDTAETTSITGLSADTTKWYGACLAPNGKIYCVPCNSTEVLVVYPGYPIYPINQMLSPYLNKF